MKRFFTRTKTASSNQREPVFTYQRYRRGFFQVAGYFLWKYIFEREICRQEAVIVRSLSGKNWQDCDKADKVSISFPATPNDKLKCFGGCNEDIRKIYHPGG